MRGSFRNRIVSCVLLLATTLGLVSCGGGDGSSGSSGSGGSGGGGSASGSGSGATGGSSSTQTFTLSGTLTGLSAGSQVVIEDNGADALTLSANGAFSFTAPVMLNGTYTVIVATQPQDATCTVQHGTGSGVTANVSNVVLQCSANTFTISGTVAGLASGVQLTLDNNAADPLVLSGDGAFTFSMPVAESGAYNVTVGSQPTGQSCSVANGQGSQVSADVTNITVSCSTDTFTIGGSVTGLAAGQQVTLEDNGGDSLTVTANGVFTFVTPVVYGSAYTVTVGTEPTGQACVVAGGSGSAVAANVGTVGITCMAGTQSFTTPGSFTWTVPAGITSVSIVAIGGGGGGSGTFGSYVGLVGGAGAVVNSTLTVTPGQTLNLVVGGGGTAGTSFLVGVSGPFGGGGGGGSSNIDAGTADQIIAGGGGGGGAAAPKYVGGLPGSVGGNAGGVGGAGGNGGGRSSTGGVASTEPGGNGGSGGTGGAETPSGDPGLNGAAGGNGNGGAGGTGGGDGSVPSPGGSGGSGIGAGTGGSDTATYRSGGGGGGYGGGASGTLGGGGGAGGSTGPAGSTFAPAANGGGPATNGGDGSIVITLQ